MIHLTFLTAFEMWAKHQQSGALKSSTSVRELASTVRLQDPKQYDSPLARLPHSRALSVSPCYQRGDTHTPPCTAASAHRCQRLQDNQQIRTLIAHCSPATDNLNTDTTEGKNKKPQASPAGYCLSQGHTKYHVLKGSRSSEGLAAPKAQRLQK